MKKFAVLCSVLCVAMTLLALFVWAEPSEIRHYTAEDLVGVTCEELGEKHKEVIFAYHDAEIAHYKRTGAFHEDVGIPETEVLPFDVLMEHFLQTNDLTEDASSENSSASARELRTIFFSKITRICITNPSLQAFEAMRQAAEELNLIDEIND